jgi:hypothetical protein
MLILVYGGKLVATMDRQHPRDLFGVMQLLAHEGITPEIRRAFVVYLASHNRPVHEVLFPPMRDIHEEFERNFDGMTVEPVKIDSLLAARDDKRSSERADRRGAAVLESLVSVEPEWPLLGVTHLEKLPGPRWKLENLTRLCKANPRKFGEQSDALARALDGQTATG